jgi:antitoxin MazE
MRVRISRWGDSLVLRIPELFADDLQLSDNSAVELTLSRGQLIVAPAHCPTLEDLVAGITDENRHAAQDHDDRVGNEIW